MRGLRGDLSAMLLNRMEYVVCTAASDADSIISVFSVCVLTLLIFYAL